MQWTSPAMQRHAALAEYLNELGLEIGDGPRTPIPQSLRHGKRSIALDPWERAVLQDCYGTGDGAPAPFASLIAEGLAFSVKCDELLARNETTDSEPTPEAQPVEGSAPDDGSTQPRPIPEAGDLARELMREAEAELEPLILDAAVGLALMEEVQRAVNALVAAGKAADAKKLTSFRNRIGQCVKQLEQLIGDDAFARAENKAEAMVPPTGELSAPDSLTLNTRSGASQGKTGQAAIGGARPLQVDEQASKTKPLAILFGASLVVWMIFIMPRFFHEQPIVLERPAFSHIPGVSSIVARPPSVFITIDAESWGDLAESDRTEALAQIGSVAAAAGYNGADVRTHDGTVVGRWLRDGGARIVTPGR